MALDKKQKIVIIGAGPVGALAALYAARRGDDVEVYELRGDLRDPSIVPLNFTKSINLALSERGVNSMKKAECPGLLDSILKDTIPMHGRMIHGMQNDRLFEQSQNYDVHGRFVRAVDRAGLNKHLLDELERMPNVKLLFNHKLMGADLKKKRAWFEARSKQEENNKKLLQAAEKKKGDEKEISFDLMIGADGAHSAVRFHLMKFARLSFQQEYIDTLWSEFHIDAADPGDETAIDGFKLSPNHLHIWPAGDFMFIAIPSMDKSFTCTLFMAESHFKAIDADPSSLIPFFEKNFPGIAGRLISEENIRKQYETNPHLPLISIKCSPYHYESSAVIVGDAAHAMVPFYGQGMNAGLEDVRTLFDILDKHTASLGSTPSAQERETAREAALKEYTEFRTPDAHAINDLAMGNYREMRSDVRSPFYLLRKGVEERLDYYFPSLGFATQYSRVSFENQRYSEVQKSVAKQGHILGYSGATLAVASIASVGAVAWRLYHR